MANIDVQLGSGIILFFATPVFMREAPDAETVNKGLRQAILKEEAEDKGIPGSSVSGWQSVPKVLEWPIPEIATMRELIEDAVVQMACLPYKETMPVEYRAYAWANVNRNGNYNRVHNHGDIHWACVYYVDCGEPETGHPMNGQIELRDPRPGAAAGSEYRYPGYTFGHGLLIDPKPGMFLVFPGWVEHFVHPFFGKGERISIAINVVIERVGETVPY